MASEKHLIIGNLAKITAYYSHIAIPIGTTLYQSHKCIQYFKLALEVELQSLKIL